MEYTTLGDTGLTVSRICLGCMSFSENGEGWTIDREMSTQLVERAIELGVNFFDSANVYSTGESEAILGDVSYDEVGHNRSPEPVDELAEHDSEWSYSS